MSKHTTSLLVFILIALLGCQKEEAPNLDLSLDGVSNAKGGPATRPDLTTGLLAYYPFSGNANDVSGNGYNGIINGATLTTDRSGRKNKAYYFENDDITVNIDNSHFTGDFTISLWAKSDITNIEYPTVIDGANQYLTVQYGTHFSNPPLALFYFSAGISTGLTFGEVSAAVDESRWNHVVIRNSNFLTSIYINGTLVQTNLAATPTQSTTIGSFMKIGNGIQLPQCMYKGKVDEVRIYKRALSNVDIAELAK